MKSRVPAYVLLIALPVVAFGLLGGYFLIDKAPKLVNAEKSAISREYRDIAESMITNGVPGVTVIQREKGWRQVSKIDKRTPWGFVEREDGRVIVWIEREDKSLVGCERDAVPARAGWWIYGGFGFVMLFVVSVAIAGIVLMRRFDRERESILSGMIHDLGTPLSALCGLVKSDPDYAALVLGSMLRMVRNAQDFLGLGRRRQFERTRFDLVPLVREAYRILEDNFTEDESGPVRFELPEKLEVEGDPMEARQILWNLFSNAAKYAAPYGPVSVTASVRGKTAAVEFADEGIGMTPRQMRRAFDRYYRAAGLHECGKGGFGIGLYTSRLSARRMGGDLTVRKNSPKGCVFTWTLIS